MKKIILLFNLILNLIALRGPINLNNEQQITPFLNENKNCTIYDSIVNITTASNFINSSGFIIHTTNNKIYIASSYLNYNENYNYEVVFNDYSRYKANIVGVAKEDKVFILEVETNIKYCPVKLSRSEFIDVGELVDILGNHKYQPVLARTQINAIGVCANCNQDTYKNYYYTLISIDLPDYFTGAAVFDKMGQLIGMITDKTSEYNYGVSIIDVNKIYYITYNLINYGKYEKNYIKYNLLNINSLTNHEKYLYSLDEGITDGVLVSSIHYLNYFIGGLNQGMVITHVNGVKINNKYELDQEFSKYKKNSKVTLTVRKISGKVRNYKVSL